MPAISVGTQRDVKSVMVVVGFLAVVVSVALGWGDLKHTGRDALRKAEDAEKKATTVETDVQAIRLQQATQGSDLRHVLDEQKVQRSLLERVAEKVGAK